MKTFARRHLRLLSVFFVALGVLAVAPGGASAAPGAGAAPDLPAQANPCPPPATTNYGGTGPFAVTVQTDSAHTYYSPSSLGSQGCARHPVIIWGNGTITAPSWYDGLLRHMASHGFIVAAANTSNAGTGQEMLQGIDNLRNFNGQSGNRFYQKVDLEHIGSTGHSQGGSGAVRAAADQRVDTTFPVEAGFFAGSVFTYRVPTLFLAGQNDSLRTGIRAQYDATRNVPAAYAELAGASHLTPLGNGGGFRAAVTAWARWQLMGDTGARNQFVGASCGLCNSSAWSVYEANALLDAGGGGGGGGGGECVQAANSAHVQAGRATTVLIFAFATGSGDYLGLTSATTSLRQTAPGSWEMVANC
jgi:pimeloyl-ACP methyl ester carboxylesterase